MYDALHMIWFSCFDNASNHVEAIASNTMRSISFSLGNYVFSALSFLSI